MKNALAIALAVMSLAACGRVGFDQRSAADAPALDATVPDAATPANRMFISRRILPANFGGRDAADSICAAEAASANLTGSFVAVLFDQGTLPTALVDANGFVRMDGRPIGNRIENLIAGDSFYPVDSFADGALATTLNNLYVWTGTATSDCNRWTAFAGFVGYGVFYATRNHTVGIGVSTTCDNAALHLWCSEVGLQTTVTPKPARGRVAFVTSEAFTSPDQADAHCRTTAATAGLSGNFAALLAIDGASPASRFSTTGEPWVTTDGLELAPTADAFFDGVWLTTVTKLGPPASAYPAIGSSSFRETPLASDNCSNWTDKTTNPAQRMTYSSNSEFLKVDTASCSITSGTFCLQL
ncbi:MAG TPA: hypothetical protein PLF40_08295 [Kofleriaceae bacterium]|nr:hypothetical protein [Kofleriaceae bacterium]